MTENEKKKTEFPNNINVYKGTGIQGPRSLPLPTEDHTLTSTDETENYLPHNDKKR